MNWDLKESEKLFILKCLNEYNWNRTQTARALNIGLRTLQRKLNRYELSHIKSRAEFVTHQLGMGKGPGGPDERNLREHENVQVGALEVAEQ